MVERSQQAAFAVHFQVTRGPDGGRAHIAGENGVVIGKLTDLLRQILRVNGFITRFRQFVEAFTRVAVIVERFIQEAAVGFLLKQRQQRGERGVDIANQRHIHFTVRADAGRVDVDLNNFGVGRVKRAVGELGAEQDQGVGVHHGVEAG